MRIMDVIAITFATMLMLPVLIAYIYHMKTPGKPMFIKQDKARDPRYFGKSFSSMVENAEIDRENNTIKLRNLEKFTNADNCEVYPNVVKDVILGFKKPFKLPENVEVLEKEVYCKENIIIENKSLECRALFSKKNIYLKNNVNIERWIDSEGFLEVGDGCHLGVSATSKMEIYMRGECTFRRLYAPAIYIGKPIDPEIDFSTIKNRESFTSKKDLTVPNDVQTIGSVRGYKDVIIGDNCIIMGNVFAEENVRIGKNCVIYGNVFTQGSIFIGKGTIIGKKGEMRSLICRDNIYLDLDVIVYGYVSCEKGGHKRGRNKYER